eukprot:CAMPEP_0183357168 /NCGR_PEP_ID=MMETSP0164_2-20130417/45529_1 /TAXON_ID=221442 /ORGANISM="Coccolithus pelagicus ssp braarudi, Strain PLY182g" /LENGTH=37 /DNA_ID= /DNA_START= /DNA_END= /DNA_ORIENTATION=
MISVVQEMMEARRSAYGSVHGHGVQGQCKQGSGVEPQ